MPTINRFPSYILIAAAILFMITFYHVFNVRKKNSDLESNVKRYNEALIVSKEKNKVLVKDALEKIEKKNARVSELENEKMKIQNNLGQLSSKLNRIKTQLSLKNKEIKSLHQLAANHKDEITTLSKSVSKSKEVLAKLSGKAGHLMTDHKKLKEENSQLQKENEKLQNDISQQKSEKQDLQDKLSSLTNKKAKLDDQLSTLTKEKQHANEQLGVLTKEKRDLGVQVEDLTKRNRVIQEGIKEKIKESYAVDRMKIPTEQGLTSPTKDHKDEEPALQHSQQKGTTDGWIVSDNVMPKTLVNKSEVSQIQVPKVTANNSEVDRKNASKFTEYNSKITQKNVSKFMVDNSDSSQNNVSKFAIDNSENTQNNISKFLVNNPELRERRETTTDSEIVPKTNISNIEHSDFFDHEKIENDGSENIEKTSRSHDDAIAPLNERPTINEEATDIQPEIIANMRHSESLNEEENENGNFENGTDNGKATREDVNSEGIGQDFRGTENDVMPRFRQIIDETIDRRNIPPPSEYGDHIKDDT